MADCPKYDLSLLVTLDARDSRTNGFISAAEAMQRMQKIYMDSGINPLQVILRIEPHQVVITDAISGIETEHIHLGMIHQPASITSNHVAGFDNIVMFIVVDDSLQQASPDLHIFQCSEGNAQDVVSQLKAAKEGKLFSAKPKQPLAVNSSYKPPTAHRMDDFELESQRLATATISYRPGPTPGQMFRQALSDEKSLKIDSDVTMGKLETLNHCFDDIEKFVGRLQMAANAFNELTRRRNDRHGGTGLGDGMLGMRARPPPASDYIDILQKFKLAFNLLAKMKSHIKNPNAPELIHHLFSPLQLIVQTSLDPVSGVPMLATKVYTPLLNADALTLLNNCMTSQESDLFSSLGQAWNISKEDWTGSVPAYFPQFFDDWSPNPAWLEDVGVMTVAAAVSSVPLHQRVPSDDTSYYYPQSNHNGIEARPAVASKPVSRSASMATTSSSVEMRQQPPRVVPAMRATAAANYAAGPPETDQERFLRLLRTRGVEIGIATGTRPLRSDKELSVTRDEILEVQDSSKNWWLCVNAYGQKGFVPYTVIKKLDTDTGSNGSSNISSPRTPRAGQPLPGMTAGAVAYGQFDGNSNGHLNATAESIQSDVLHKFTKVSPFTGNSLQKNYQQPFPDEIKPVKVLRPAQRTATDDLNDEFKNLQLRPRPARRNEAPVQMVFIDKTSTPEEIREWLVWKGFSDFVLRGMSGCTGQNFFSLTRGNCERLFGPDEGSRLYSQMLVQKNRSGFRTPRASELEAVLKYRKKQTDSKDLTSF